MYINQKMVKDSCIERGITIQELLKASGVSSNAYYTLLRKESILPKSLIKLAEMLDVPPSTLLVDEATLLKEHQETEQQVKTLSAVDTDLDPGTIRITIELLKLSPLDRLRKGLQFAR